MHCVHVFERPHSLAFDDELVELVVEAERSAGLSSGYLAHRHRPRIIDRARACFAAAGADVAPEAIALECVTYTAGTPLDRLGYHRDVELRIVVQLTDERAYGGGDLHFLTEPPVVMPRGRGTVAVFPPGVYHEVTPLTFGERRRLVAAALA
jgi:hypothetical protein